MTPTLAGGWRIFSQGCHSFAETWMVKELVTYWWGGEGWGAFPRPCSPSFCLSALVSRLIGLPRRQGFRKDVLFSDIWPSILISGNTEISLEREKERTEKPLKLLGETKTLIGLGDSWDVGGIVGGSEEGDAKDNTHFYNKTWLFLQVIV